MKCKHPLLKVAPLLPVMVGGGLVAVFLSGCCTDCNHRLPFPTIRQSAQANAAVRMAQHAAVAYSAIQQVNRASSGACPQANPLSDSQIELNYGSGCTTETGQTYRGRVRITRSDQSVYTVEFFNFDTGANGSVSGTCTLRSQSSAAQMELSADLVVQSPSCVAQFTLQGYLALQASGAVQWSGTGVYTSPYTGRTICHFESVVVERSCPTPLSGKVQVSSSTAVAFEVYHTACGVATLREGMDTHREEWTSSTIAYPCQPPTIRP